VRNTQYKKLVLVVLDGFGVASFSRGNAIAQAAPKVIDSLVNAYPTLTLQASGPVVGLPWGEMGNSEVGHLNMGAGRIVGQDLPRITMAIGDRSFFKNQQLLGAIDHAQKHDSRLHLIGMISDGGVHSFDQHLYALLGLAEEQGVQEVYLHMFTDGRDTAQKVALEALERLDKKIKEIGINAKIATIAGRFYAMDRGRHWEQTEAAYQAIVNGLGEEALSATECIQNNYDKQVFDEMIRPTVLMDVDPAVGSKNPVVTVRDNDAIIFFNFRSDRMIQLVQAFVQPQMMGIQSKHQQLQNLYVVTMTQYASDLPVHIAFPPTDLHNNVAEVISKAGLSQFHIAESEKYAHVTSFFNGGVSQELVGEERIIITSPNNTKNYVDHPQMSAEELTSTLVDKIVNSTSTLFVANYANPDMVGHTGNLQAAIEAIACIDGYMKKVVDAVLQVDGVLIITGDHGNVEQMIDARTGQVNKDHSTNPVPFILISKAFKRTQVQEGGYTSLASKVPGGVISDIAPTILALLGIPKPPEMTSVNLLQFIE
jgi:2,3-bisphosphoglycerate-independent phosphoglycerate mutase